MAWLFLISGGFFETLFAFCLNKAGGDTHRILWFSGFVLSVSVSMFLLYLSMKGEHGIPMGTAYAVWTGIGAAGAVITGIFILHEPAHFMRLFFLCTLIASVIGLKFFA